jgi:hypothetical protein
MVTPQLLNIPLNSKNILLLFLHILLFLFLNKFRNFVYEVTDALHNFFSSSLKSSVTDFGYSYMLFSDKVSITVSLWSLYNLQSQKTCSSVCSPSPYSHSAVGTMLNLLELALRLEWPALIRFRHEGWSKCTIWFFWLLKRPEMVVIHLFLYPLWTWYFCVDGTFIVLLLHVARLQSCHSPTCNPHKNILLVEVCGWDLT